MPLMDSQSLLIIAGAGQYPRLLAEGARAAGVSRLAVVAFRGQTDSVLKREADMFAKFGVGEIGKVCDWISASGIKNVVMAGQISPVSLFATKFDATARAILDSLPVKNAHTIFGAVLKKLESLGVDIIPASSYMERWIPAPGVLTSRAPDAREEADIKHGYRAAMTIGTVDIGQTVVVKDGMVLAVEAFEGTNAAIKRGAKLGGRGSVVVKIAREGHDMRFDIPVIGAKTFKVMRSKGISALAFQAGRTIFLDQEEVIREANKRGIAIVALPTDLQPAPTRPFTSNAE